MFYLTPSSRRRNSLVRRSELFDMDKFFNDFFSDSFIPGIFTLESSIRADIRETDNQYIIEAELPGVKKEDIKLELRDNALTIAVDYDEETKVEEKGYIRKERKTGSFSRSFYVGDIKHEDVTAKYDNGILTVELPKKEEVKEKKRSIEIQ